MTRVIFRSFLPVPVLLSFMLVLLGVSPLFAQNLDNPYLDSFITSGGAPDGVSWIPNEKTVIVRRDLAGRVRESHRFDFNGTSWDPVERYWATYETETSGNLLEEIWYSWDAGTSDWVPWYRVIYQYDASDRVTEEIGQVWDAGTQQWINDSRVVWNYSASTIERIQQTWTGSTWENQTRYLFNFNASSQITEFVYQVWDAVSSSWKNSFRYLYSYDANGNQTERIDQLWSNTTGTWVNNFRYTFQYNSMGLRVYELGKTWNSTTSSWEPSWQGFYTYDDRGNLIGSFSQNWDPATSAWVNVWMEQSQYNPAGKRIFSISLIWDNTTQSWVNDRQYAFEYLLDSILTDEKVWEWNRTDARWYTFNRTQYFYTLPFTSAGDFPEEASHQPFHLLVTEGTLLLVSSHPADHSTYSVSLRTVSGKEVYARTFTHSLQLDLRHLPRGNYFITVQDTRGTVVYSERFGR